MLTAGLALGLSCGELGAQEIELVESFPVGTDFDQPDIRNTQEVWLELIKGAKKEILWQTFYLAHEDGKSTGPVLRALKHAARRGIQIKFLVDEKFEATYPETLDWLKKQPNVKVRTSGIGRWYGGVMHAKMMLVDGQKGFLGSQNFDWRSLEHIRELGVLFSDANLVRFYTKNFQWEWDSYNLEAAPNALPKLRALTERVGEHLVQATASPNATNAEPELGDEHQILKLLKNAEQSVEIALLSYSPVTRDGKGFYTQLDSAIRAAAVRGVKVRILLSHWVEKKKTLDHLLSLDALNNVELRACRIPLTEEGEIPFARVHHSKYLVVDQAQSWLGTANWSKGYFHSSRNYGLVFLESPISERLRQLFDFDWQRSTALHQKK